MRAEHDLAQQTSTHNVDMRDTGRFELTTALDFQTMGPQIATHDHDTPGLAYVYDVEAPASSTSSETTGSGKRSCESGTSSMGKLVSAFEVL